MTQAARPHMQPGSTVLFISSTTAHAGFAACGAYSASKGAVEAMTRSLAAELAPDIRVNVIAPGFVATPMVTQQFDANPDMEGGLITKTPVGFVGVAEDIANAALFLSSDLSRYMTGSTVVVDGGWTAQG
jgi:NAD(P)-dependent dehydrogenase (short-subunit alcohol dehydrogenase family)